MFCPHGGAVNTL